MILWTANSAIQLQLLAVSLILCGLIGLERQFRQKAAGFRTHVLVGVGSATFTLVSGYGFSPLLGEEVILDPSRIAAQVVSGIGFIGAGVIFTRSQAVRGLTTAATIWVSAAVGMAAGAGLVPLALGLTAAHLLALFALAPLVNLIPTQDSNRVVRVTYHDGEGALRKILKQATDKGFSALVIGSRRHQDTNLIDVNLRFKGKLLLRDLMQTIQDIQAVESVYLVDGDQDAGDE